MKGQIYRLFDSNIGQTMGYRWLITHRNIIITGMADYSTYRAALDGCRRSYKTLFGDLPKNKLIMSKKLITMNNPNFLV